MADIRLKLLLAYKGTRFQGWQVQDRSRDKSARTVQGVLETAVAKIVGQDVRVHGSGRTDSGVHAQGQVAHVDVPERLSDVPWVMALNSLLPSDVSVLNAEPAPLDFHARFSAASKIYSYNLWLSRQYVLPQKQPFVWSLNPVDLDAMDRAARLLEGEHDFACFRNQGSETATTVRTLFEISRDPADSLPEPDPANQVWPEVVWRFHANGFLKQMVRNLMGCLVEVGRGKMDEQHVLDLLASGDRTLAPATAPAQGLTLERVLYPDG
ncbi:MAG: tRNA pseudouridine(38-40) synthase TruA [Desulfovibrio sp.]|nr:MAG: tRNA pseudouridine(38-40) synthase TruA [Desulfovibrio sp.]